MANGIGAYYDDLFFDGDTPTHTATGTPYRTKVTNTINDINNILGGGVGDFLAKLLGRNNSKDLEIQEYEFEDPTTGLRRQAGGSSGGGGGGGSGGGVLSGIPTWVVAVVVGGVVYLITAKKK